MLAPSLQFTQQPRASRIRDTGFVPLPVSRITVNSGVYAALAEGRLTALVLPQNTIDMPGCVMAVFNQRAPKAAPLELVMGRSVTDSYGLEAGYRLVPVALLSKPQAGLLPDEPVQAFAAASLAKGYIFISAAPSLHHKVGRSLLDGSTVCLRDEYGAERHSRAAVVSKYDFAGIAAHARLVTVPRAL